MTTNDAATPSSSDKDRLVDAVLFDLHNTTLQGDYFVVGLIHVGELVADWWKVDPASFPTTFYPAAEAAMRRYSHDDFYLMRDVFADALGMVGRDCGTDPTDDELFELVVALWDAAVPAAVPMDGAIETFDALRDAGLKVGIVSFADRGMFEGLITQLGFADHVDIAVSSEAARSCKPHAGIFQHALDALGVPAERAMFVGDQIDSDVVGGNRLGMVTVHIPPAHWGANTNAFGDDPMMTPDHRLATLREVVDLVI
jgi:HAD superfamily hydrolase (TIGR01509 family)